MGCLNSKPSSGSRASKYALDEDRTTGMHPGKPSTAANLPQSKTQPAAGDAAKEKPQILQEPIKLQVPAAGTAVSKPVRPKLDPKDFQFIGLKGTCAVKAPGTINGQAFTIDNCQDCDLYLLDRCAQVNIDECRNCRIFIGPTAGSIFLRDSSNVKCAFITRQLRLRDVRDADIALLCRTQPIIEESTNVALTCYDLAYPALAGQMSGAKLDVLQNFWWHVYDFTPREGNWRYLPGGTRTVEVLGGLPDQVKQALGIDGNTPVVDKETAQVSDDSLVSSWGERAVPDANTQYLFAVFPPDKAEAARQFIQTAKHKALVLTTNQAEVQGDTLDTLSIKAGWPKGAEKKLAPPGSCTGVELSVEAADVSKCLREQAQQLGGHVTDTADAGQMFRKLGLAGM